MPEIRMFWWSVVPVPVNAIITPLVNNGQSVHQIYVEHENELMCSEKTIYNYIDACLFDVRNIDLPRKVKFRERYKKPEFKVDKGCRIGRNYQEYLKFKEKNPDLAEVQMDSVMGVKGGKCLLTIHFVESSLMLAFIRDANTSQSVIDVFNGLDAFTRKWADVYTVVTWDQRNCGKSYDAEQNDIVLTREIFMTDGKEVTEFILNYLSKDKITVLGHSWGSIYGANLVLEYPEYYEYIVFYNYRVRYIFKKIRICLVCA